MTLVGVVEEWAIANLATAGRVVKVIVVYNSFRADVALGILDAGSKVTGGSDDTYHWRVLQRVQWILLQPYSLMYGYEHLLTYVSAPNVLI